MLRIGLLTSGGDCQGLNAAMRGVAKALYEAFDEVEIHGILDGYRGLIQDRIRLMEAGGFFRNPDPRRHYTGYLPLPLQTDAGHRGGWRRQGRGHENTIKNGNWTAL